MAYVSADTRREQLIEAAVRVIAREGADRATTRKIAEEAKAPLASLHYCFQNKENLLLAVFTQLSGEMPVEADPPVGENMSVGQIMEQRTTRAMQWIVENPLRARAMIEVTLWAERYDPELSVTFYEGFFKSSEADLRKAETALSDEELHSLMRVGISIVDGLSLQMLTNGDKERALRDTATACAMLKAFLGESERDTV